LGCATPPIFDNSIIAAGGETRLVSNDSENLVSYLSSIHLLAQTVSENELFKKKCYVGKTRWSPI